MRYVIRRFVVISSLRTDCEESWLGHCLFEYTDRFHFTKKSPNMSDQFSHSTREIVRHIRVDIKIDIRVPSPCFTKRPHHVGESKSEFLLGKGSCRYLQNPQEELLTNKRTNHQIPDAACIVFIVIQMWRDEFLSWNPDKYGGIRAISVRPDRIWRPDIALYNV